MKQPNKYKQTTTKWCVRCKKLFKTKYKRPKVCPKCRLKLGRKKLIKNN